MLFFFRFPFRRGAWSSSLVLDDLVGENPGQPLSPNPRGEIQKKMEACSSVVILELALLWEGDGELWINIGHESGGSIMLSSSASASIEVLGKLLKLFELYSFLICKKGVIATLYGCEDLMRPEIGSHYMRAIMGSSIL